MRTHSLARRAAVRTKLRQRAIAFVLLAISVNLFAETAIAQQTPAASATTSTSTTTTVKTTNTTTNTTWGGLGWGIGLAANFDPPGTRVANATLVNNIVRVTDTSSNVGIGFVLEAHYFLRDFQYNANTRRSFHCDVICSTDFAVGPFVAIEIGNGGSATPTATGPITGYALGLMVGMRNPDAIKTSPDASWNFGIGMRIDPRAQVLGDGIYPNQPLPPGETIIRYKTEPRIGLMLISSFSF